GVPTVLGAASGNATTAPTSQPAPTEAPAASTSAPNQQPVPSRVPPAAAETVPVPAPAAAVRDYYNAINARQYAVTWNTLSPRFQTEVNQNNLTAYENYWNTVSQVFVADAQTLERTNTSATVRTNLRFTYNDGRVVADSTTFRLIWDASQRRWLFDSVVR
ncbi:MAG: hypothetical protein LC737_07780, partial [Chloroflexi bacterium]|nr:hypothetical protein [Chloroflexota bacterium]